MLTKWPDVEDTTLLRAARQAALDALDGTGPVGTFRAALIAAAEDAGGPPPTSRSLCFFKALRLPFIASRAIDLS